MTKYILHGGNTGINENDKRIYFEEIFNIEKVEINFLFIPFAQIEEKWTSAYEKLIKNIENTIKNKNINFNTASLDQNILNEQIANSDIVYFLGGNEIPLKKVISKINKLEELLKNRIIVGTSAGANILSKYYFSNDREQIEEGLCVLPIKTICHYSFDKSDKLNKLKDYKENLPIYALPEGKYEVVNN